MSTEGEAIAGGPGGWERREIRPRTDVLVAMAFIAGLICGFFPYAIVYELGELISEHPWIALALAVAAGFLLRETWSRFSLRQRWLYMDDRKIVLLRRAGRHYERMTTIHTARLRDVAFAGGSFWTGALRVTLRGPAIVSRGRDSFLGWFWGRARESNESLRSGTRCPLPRIWPFRPTAKGSRWA